MPEAVIVSAVRTPIGRANKGVLKDVGIATLCIGGGQGLATIIQRMS
jgi:acetyl-CoA acetyltransferase